MSDGNVVYLGCYTAEAGGKGEGIAAAHRDPITGQLTPVGLAARTPAPSFLVRHPRLPVLYAANELAEGFVSAWAVAGDGTLSPLGSQPTGGAQPCHLAVSADGQHLVTANYGSGSVSVHPLDLLGVPGARTDLRVHPKLPPPTADGGGAAGDTAAGDTAAGDTAEGEIDPERQEGPHAHMVSPEPDSDRVWVVDLGGDALYPYRLEAASGVLVADRPPVRLRAGTGPRHLTRHPGGDLRYLAGELDGTLTSFEADPVAGTVRVRERVAASASAGSVLPSELAVRRDGAFLYLANRGPDTIAVFALRGGDSRGGDSRDRDPRGGDPRGGDPRDGDPRDGDPRYVAEVATGGRWPRHLAIVDDFLYVANERSHTVVTLRMDQETGVPEVVGPPLKQGSPTCILPF